MYSLVFYVPSSHLDLVKDAVFSAGGGKVGDYEKCCWQTLGQGQFAAGPGAKPFIGEAGGDIELVEEYRVELVVLEEFKSDVVLALKNAHPYEEVAYHLIAVES